MVCKLLGREHDLWGVYDSLNMICVNMGSEHTTLTNKCSLISVVTGPSAWCSSFTGRVPVMLSTIQDHHCKNLLIDYQKSIIKCSPVAFECPPYILFPPWTSEFVICSPSVCLRDILLTFTVWLLDFAVKRTFSCWRGNKIVYLCACDRRCHYNVSVIIHLVLTFSVSHLFVLALIGLLWKRAYLLNFHCRQSW